MQDGARPLELRQNARPRPLTRGKYGCYDLNAVEDQHPIYRGTQRQRPQSGRSRSMAQLSPVIPPFAWFREGASICKRSSL